MWKDKEWRFIVGGREVRKLFSLGIRVRGEVVVSVFSFFLDF